MSDFHHHPLLPELSSILSAATCDNFETKVTDSLRKISSSFDGSRSFLMKVIRDRVSIRSEWFASDLYPLSPTYHDCELSTFADIFTKISQNQHHVIVANGPKPSHSLVFSLPSLYIPVRLDGYLWGFAGFVGRKVADPSSDALNILTNSSELVVSVIEAMEAEKSLKRTHNMLMSAFERKQSVKKPKPESESAASKKSHLELINVLPDEGIAAYFPKSEALKTGPGRKSRVYGCLKCEYLTKKRSNARRHYQRCQGEVNKNKCVHCNQGPFASLQAYAAHFRGAHKSKKVMLDIKPTSTRTRRSSLASSRRGSVDMDDSDFEDCISDDDFVPAPSAGVKRTAETRVVVKTEEDMMEPLRKKVKMEPVSEPTEIRAPSSTLVEVPVPVVPALPPVTLSVSLPVEVADPTLPEQLAGDHPYAGWDWSLVRTASPCGKHDDACSIGESLGGDSSVHLDADLDDEIIMSSDQPHNCLDLDHLWTDSFAMDETSVATMGMTMGMGMGQLPSGYLPCDCGDPNCPEAAVCATTSSSSSSYAPHDSFQFDSFANIESLFSNATTTALTSNNTAAPSASGMPMGMSTSPYQNSNATSLAPPALSRPAMSSASSSCSSGLPSPCLSTSSSSTSGCPDRGREWEYDSGYDYGYSSTYSDAPISTHLHPSSDLNMMMMGAPNSHANVNNNAGVFSAVTIAQSQPQSPPRPAPLSTPSPLSSTPSSFVPPASRSQMQKMMLMRSEAAANAILTTSHPQPLSQPQPHFQNQGSNMSQYGLGLTQFSPSPQSQYPSQQVQMQMYQYNMNNHNQSQILSQNQNYFSSAQTCPSPFSQGQMQATTAPLRTTKPVQHLASPMNSQGASRTQSQGLNQGQRYTQNQVQGHNGQGKPHNHFNYGMMSNMMQDGNTELSLFASLAPFDSTSF
eukprot:TRINITY_DN1633_c0_g1::TRINITY_DN1633_c0_g1_i1::g.17720::m.17720 TRINITY_DN1633_c0_g1::TRINITY_DN1633_c0_g1_i1::g.17720  ORF type:complete len:928 (-),score=193.33 TRINITY_DN1633_c0_g1_i1:736-3474(-)